MKKYDGVCPKCESDDISTTDTEFNYLGHLIIGMSCGSCGYVFTGTCKEVLVKEA